LWCGKFISTFVCRYLIVTTVKESLKSSYAWQSYARNKKGTVFLTHSVGLYCITTHYCCHVVFESVTCCYQVAKQSAYETFLNVPLPAIYSYSLYLFVVNSVKISQTQWRIQKSLVGMRPRGGRVWGYSPPHGGGVWVEGCAPSQENVFSILDLKMASFGALWDAGGGCILPSPRIRYCSTSNLLRFSSSLSSKVL